VNEARGTGSNDGQRDETDRRTTQPKCTGCGRDLSQLPNDIKNCPYCGKPISPGEAVSTPMKPSEPSPGRGRIRRYTKIIAVLGLTVAMASIVLAMSLSQNTLLAGTVVGISIAIASGLIRTFERGLIVRRSIGAVMLLIPIIPLFFGGPPILPLMYAPGLIIAAYMLRSRRRGARSGSVVLLGAFLYAAIWLYGLYAGSLLDGSWSGTLLLLWYTRVPQEAPSWPFGIGYMVNLWAMQIEKALALTAGSFLLSTSLLSRMRASARKATAIALIISLLPMLLLTPPPRESIEGGNTLRVTLLTFNHEPISKLEVNVGVDRGLTPPLGGSLTTDENGTATFHVRQGNYVIYLDQRWFPSDFDYPSQPYPVNITEGTHEFTIILHHSQKTITGETILKVTASTVDGMPVSNLEVDVGKEPGPPPEGGKATTDENGTATFHVDPGSYYVYFNMNNFPSDLEYPKELYPVNVHEGKVNEINILLNHSTSSGSTL